MELAGELAGELADDLGAGVRGGVRGGMNAESYAERGGQGKDGGVRAAGQPDFHGHTCAAKRIDNGLILKALAKSKFNEDIQRRVVSGGNPVLGLLRLALDL